MKDIEKQIREHWFKDHVAELIDLGEIQILNWKKPGTGIYRVRYIFDGNMLYISGDVGEAVYWLTWKASVHSFDGLNLGYFTGKLQAFSDDRWDFSSEKAVKRLREWLKDIKEGDQTYDHDDMRNLFDDARRCGSRWEWVEIVHRYESLISSLDADYWEWFYDMGNETPARLWCYLIGLQMASEQLKVAEQLSA